MSGGRYLAQERAAFPSTRDAFDAEPNRSKMQKDGEKTQQKALGSIKRSCTQSGCPNLTEGGGKCSSCAKSAEQARGETVERVYWGRSSAATSAETGDRSHLPDSHPTARARCE